MAVLRLALSVFYLFILITEVVGIEEDVVLLTGGYGSGRTFEVFAQPRKCPDIYGGSSPIYPGRLSHTSHNIDGQVLLCGGYNTKTSCIQLINGTFKDHSQLNERRHWHSGVVLGGKLTIMGGWESPRSLETLNGTTWSLGKEMEHDMVGSCVVALDNMRALVTGGRMDYDGVSMYHVDAGHWTRKASLPNKRWGHSCVVLADGKVLVAGGEDYNGDALNTAVMYNVENDSWEELPGRMNVARQFGQMVNLNGRVLFVGGERKHNNGLNSIEEFDEMTGTWKLLSDTLHPWRVRTRFAALVVPFSVVGCPT